MQNLPSIMNPDFPYFSIFRYGSTVLWVNAVKWCSKNEARGLLLVHLGQRRSNFKTGPLERIMFVTSIKSSCCDVVLAH